MIIDDREFVELKELVVSIHKTVECLPQLCVTSAVQDRRIEQLEDYQKAIGLWIKGIALILLGGLVTLVVKAI